ncbi:hypothetical protein AGABI1DRAFT_47382 [Agaricus bisporus var. burnettii JB137-S8]|uniref:Uncharacterized protein n=1 Tax=Agaricus bisporus var. burnettii (strain JB137-S8 / ATCC MYA-4627 / FGSC 10392) TaxID=597362 RepID=K5WHS0_AGABU|nr:uncharacterized protein AGABI1DRAFT_47382 [Agaricus bisporus var. burnettii JB137-S8]EKM74821.1 hypothetical protein AGABI1DRAFT_47382 [Agaricus bisporus var. burnettii JB137-S8]
MRPVEGVIQDLLNDPVVGKNNVYAPFRVFRDSECLVRKYGEMWTGDWWWETQKKLPEGATLVPVIIGSDKTQLTSMSGDKQAYPVYLSLGNIPQETRRKASSRTMVLIGYIPVTKLECFSHERRSREGHQLFHQCMETMFEPLRESGKLGVVMKCADGKKRRIHPILAAYIADYPEQCLVCCCKENTCPTCTVLPIQRGDPLHSPPRDPDQTLCVLVAKMNGFRPSEFEKWSLRAVKPFWRHLPHCNIFTSITPDILHQLHKGIFKDHLVSWTTEAMAGGIREVDRRFKSMPKHFSIRHFKNGISSTSQWTGTEHKNMEKVYLGILANATDPQVIRTARAALDFIYYAQMEVHTDETLGQLDQSWATFHANKDVFRDLGIRQHFNISKLHNIRHYVDSIRTLGSATGYNTEATERLHIDFAKVGYRASNKKDYIKQMTTWLARQEAMRKFSAYLNWAVPGLKPTEKKDDDQPSNSVDKPGDSRNDVDEDDYTDSDEATPEASWKIAKAPAYGHLNATSIEQEFSVTMFPTHLLQYLQKTYPHIPHTITPNSRFPVFRRLILHLPVIPEVSSEGTRDIIVTNRGKSRRITTRGIQKGTPPHFSTVLVRIHPASPHSGPHDGIAVAQVRLIFRLTDNPSETPLLYVHWFKPLRDPVPDLGMYQVSFSSHNLQRRASVISVIDIIGSCHLIPKFGGTIDTTWTSDNVFDQAPAFYLNPYTRYWDFYLLRYLYERHQFNNRSQREVSHLQQLARRPVQWGQ